MQPWRVQTEIMRRHIHEYLLLARNSRRAALQVACNLGMTPLRDREGQQNSSTFKTPCVLARSRQCPQPQHHEQSIMGTSVTLWFFQEVQQKPSSMRTILFVSTSAAFPSRPPPPPLRTTTLTATPRPSWIRTAKGLRRRTHLTRSKSWR